MQVMPRVVQGGISGGVEAYFPPVWFSGPGLGGDESLYLRRPLAAHGFTLAGMPPLVTSKD